MTSRGWSALAICLLAALAISAGLAVIGGPSEARKERRDRKRDDDLSDLTMLVRCLAEADGKRLPARLVPGGACPWQGALTDPLTGHPYRYQVTGPRSYLLCADYERPEDRAPALRRHDVQGCVQGHYLPSPPGPPGAAATLPYRD